MKYITVLFMFISLSASAQSFVVDTAGEVPVNSVMFAPGIENFGATYERGMINLGHISREKVLIWSKARKESTNHYSDYNGGVVTLYYKLFKGFTDTIPELSVQAEDSAGTVIFTHKFDKSEGHFKKDGSYYFQSFVGIEYQYTGELTIRLFEDNKYKTMILVNKR